MGTIYVDEIKHQSAQGSGTITIGASGETVALAAGATSSGFGGITEADHWRLTTTITANVDPISANLERVDDATFAKIGTGMSVSSGIWSFPSTGLYKIVIFMTGQPTAGDNVGLAIYGTADNGSNYDHLASAFFGANSTNVLQGSNSTFFNCTNVSTHKIKFAAESITAGSEIGGSTDYNATSFQFIRLGDSQ